MPLKNATNHALRLFVLLCISSFHTESFGVERPEGYGQKHSFDYYDQLLQKTKSSIPERHRELLDSCKSELEASPKQCMRVDKLKFSCETDLPITTRNINYCVDVAGEQLTISRDFRVFFLPLEHGDQAAKEQMKKMFYSAVECMKAFYKHEGIHLNLTFKETRANEPVDINVTEYSGRGAAYDRINLSNGDGYFPHDQLCQLVSHEISHHFALPDRYQRRFRGRPCSEQKIYPEETLMAMHGRDGFAGYSALKLHEHDLHNMLYHACPDTIKRYMETSPDGLTELGQEAKTEKKKKTTESSDIGGLIFFLVLIVSSIFSIVSRGSRKNRKDDEEVED